MTPINPQNDQDGHEEPLSPKLFHASPLSFAPVSQAQTSDIDNLGRSLRGMCTTMHTDARHKGEKSVVGSRSWAGFRKSTTIDDTEAVRIRLFLRHQLMELIDTKQKIRYGR